MTKALVAFLRCIHACSNRLQHSETGEGSAAIGGSGSDFIELGSQGAGDTNIAMGNVAATHIWLALVTQAYQRTW